jgi:SNF2 family DNA or RNA helicase
MKWFRVVLDEAQVVRNRLTQSAQCIFRLQTKYRWCLSGTPIFNGVADIFSYLHFVDLVIIAGTTSTYTSYVLLSVLQFNTCSS